MTAPPLSARALAVLGRFPAHLDVARPGKQIAHVVDGLATDFDVFASQLAGVRTAHRLAQAPTLRDLALLGALHGIDDDDLSLVAVRAGRLQQLADALGTAVAAGVPADVASSAGAVLDAFGIAGGDERLAALAPAGVSGAPPDLVAAAAALLDGLRAHLGFGAVLEATRRRVADICQLHADGNGTVRALLLGALSGLDLEVDLALNAEVRRRIVAEGRTEGLDLRIHDELFHSADHFWHSTYVRDSMPLAVEIAVTLPHGDVPMGATIALAVLAQRSGVAVSRLIARAVANGHDGAVPRTRVPFGEADAIGALEGFTVERARRGTIELASAIAPNELALKLGLADVDLRREVAAIVGAAPGPEPVSPQVAAIVARKYGYRTVLFPAPRQTALGIEENPLRREQRPPIACRHGMTFTVRRRGFGRRALRIQFTGVEDLTMGPMLVNRDEGRGVGFFGPVPADSRLLFTEEGLVFLDGADVAPLAYSWAGACFADVTPHARDFVFDGTGTPARRRATFAETVPLGALDREAVYPHGAGFLGAPGVNVGETRFAFFVQQGHVASRAPIGSTAADLTPSPRTVVAYADRSVLAGGPDERSPTAPNANDPVAAQVTLSWLEHEGYAVRVIIPARFRYLSGDGPSVEERLQRALERVRPAGVAVRVEFADDRWTLGEGALTDEEPLDDDPNDLLRGGTALWPPDDA